MKILRKLFRAITKRFLKRKPVKRRKKPRKISHPVHKTKAKKKTKALRRTKKPRKFKKLPRPPKKKPPKPVAQGELVGEITHYFSKIKVCVIHVTHGVVTVGDRIEIRGHTTRFTQKILSLQIENSDVTVAHKGQMAGLKVDKKCRAGDQAFKIVA